MSETDRLKKNWPVAVDCKAFASMKLEEAKELYDSFPENKKNYRVYIIMVGDNKESDTYVKNKTKKLRYVGIDHEIVRVSSKWGDSELGLFDHVYGLICDIQKKDDCLGVIIQLPTGLDKHYEQMLIDCIDSDKDLDGLSFENSGAIYTLGKDAITMPNCAVPCTAWGVYDLIQGVALDSISDADIAVVGRSNLVGRPLARLLESADATVTLMHSHTKCIPGRVLAYDIVVLATGVPHNLCIDDFAFGKTSLIIDVGTTYVDGKLCGDLCPEPYLYYDYSRMAYTPVPGGVGQITTTYFVKQCVKLLKYRLSLEAFKDEED